MWIYGIGALVIIIIYFSFSMASRNKYDHIVNEFKDDYPLMFMAPVSLHILATFNIMERFHSQISFIQQKMISLYGSRDSLKHTRIFVSQLLSISLLGLLGTFLVPLLGDGDDVLFFAGLVFTFMIPALQVNSLAKKEKERKQAILLELPEVVNKIILLINAGETVQQALIRCVELKYTSDSPLYDELTIAVNRLTSNEPFPLVMNEFSKKCSIQEVSIFTTTVLLNYRKGGQDLILSLRELSHELWEKRKSISKIKGEEASSKLVFPLIFIFVAVMIIVGYPAITIL
ncbi:type II secretion system F family protein [Salipaludibacillus daqingensis]|uniref:type II secretion system F family protein n=1 Tax=Salipaludibacillus daqingensis TaxID=3041001 RepID=UPI00247673CD|nr:type II secretion system F family protein [Salipaludibacillus daqingensis]